eukprot:SAG22_NODE_1699_length_3787_cov_60.283623_4_plen_83_part_00
MSPFDEASFWGEERAAQRARQVSQDDPGLPAETQPPPAQDFGLNSKVRFEHIRAAESGIFGDILSPFTQEFQSTCVGRRWRL